MDEKPICWACNGTKYVSSPAFPKPKLELCAWCLGIGRSEPLNTNHHTLNGASS